MHGRNGGNTKIDGFFANPHLDATVLREALLGDTHRAGHDLETADDGTVKTLRRRLHFLEHTIDAETQAQLGLEGLDMDITRPV